MLESLINGMCGMWVGAWFRFGREVARRAAGSSRPCVPGAGFRVLATGVCSIAVVAHKSLLLVVGS